MKDLVNLKVSSFMAYKKYSPFVLQLKDAPLGKVILQIVICCIYFMQRLLVVYSRVLNKRLHPSLPFLDLFPITVKNVYQDPLLPYLNIENIFLLTLLKSRILLHCKKISVIHSKLTLHSTGQFAYLDETSAFDLENLSEKNISQNI